ncbi:MAG TPA: thiamine pyrophosphate-binding protein [Stellaceae bacterium]|jgi:acetolactate synthase-1/2/3 large subunit|nr:thiamine pyrophosphate-binding protein [Stellaceae bacterium]
MAKRTGGEILVAALRAHGVDRIFGVPGESYLPLLDALYAQGAAAPIAFVTCRHEAGATNMAEADAKLTGRPGICAVSRGPGAMHAAIGLHTAQQDSTPLILLVGQVPRAHRGLGAFQEMDFTQVFASVAKYVAEIDDPADIPRIVAVAYRAAMTGRRGPVVLSLPEDVLAEASEVADLPPIEIPPAAPDAQAMAVLSDSLASAQRPLMVLGGSGWSPEACADIIRFAEAHDLPVASGFRCQDLVPLSHELYVGDLGIGPGPGLKKRVAETDLLLVVGERLGDITTQGYTLLARPKPQQPFVHVHPEPAELGRVFQPDLAIVADIAAFAQAAVALNVPAPPSRRDWARDARADYLAYHAIPPSRPRNGCVDMAEVMSRLREVLPDDAIVTNGAGNYCGWVNRFNRYNGFRTQLAPVSGAMGYGLPAAIAAKLRHPDRMVVAFAGDGCFTMAMTELATAMQQRAAIIVLVVNNGTYGSIQMHQERQFPGHSIAIALTNPDFAALARSFGAFGESVSHIGAFGAAFDRAVAANRPAVIELRTDPELITPATTVAAIRDQALATRQQP